MPHPDDVQTSLDFQFEKMDEMYANDDLRVFGRDTSRIFKEVDVIRRKQIELATEHISLESIDDMSLPVIQTSGDVDDEYKRNLVYFNKKEMALKSLMNKLDALGQIMNDFRERSDLNPHTMSHIRETSTTTTTTIAPTSVATHTRNMSAANALKTEYYSQTAQASSSSASTATAQNTNDHFIKTHQPSNPRESISVLSFDQSPLL
ncbi:hypothetical protein MAM1_0019d01717 [Mucor ambiguus]|uniref:Uncharacterized protein n=1 Tax=Mucor ambiguus TaxID=91626 RepID=A0A0C9LRS9_9FUNG|nr:hypothetical protein MAM1_0019d01717 [Mucor ambiguus]